LPANEACNLKSGAASPSFKAAKAGKATTADNTQDSNTRFMVNLQLIRSLNSQT
jgi:hypothetical protein